MSNVARIFICSLALLFANASHATDNQTHDRLPRAVEINGVELLRIPAGWFWYVVGNGDVANLAPDQPRYRDVKVWLDDYYIGKYEARARDFERYLNAVSDRHQDLFPSADTESCTVRKNDAGRYVLIDAQNDMPATNLSWQVADEFARWMGMRLPNEAEWVKAARGTDKRIWPWGNQYPDDTLANFAGGSTCQSMAVTGHPAGVSPFGVYNLAGNVFEFVADWYNHARDASLKDGVRNPPLATEGSAIRGEKMPQKIIKGGRWASEALSISIAHRERTVASTGFLCYGARFAMDADAVRAALREGRAIVLAP